jgi:hypothetical protein
MQQRPRKYQGKISRCGDKLALAALNETARSLPVRSKK